jgi:hypothetical protein
VILRGMDKFVKNLGGIARAAKVVEPEQKSL